MAFGKDQLTDKSSFLELMERILLVIFLCGTLILFVSHLNVEIGFDAGQHLRMLSEISWFNPNTNMEKVFYGYHPPLTFLLARSIFLLGLPKVVSVQILSTLACLLAFFAFRSTLNKLSLLKSLVGITLLYIVFGMPILGYLSVSVNMDSVILALAVSILLFSVDFFSSDDKNESFRINKILIISLLIALGMLSKFSGILLISIPVLVAIFFKRKGGLRSNILSALLIIWLSGLIFGPYYFLRYYKNEGTPFPSNTNTFDRAPQIESRKKRDSNPAKFIAELFMPSPAHKNGPEFRDVEIPRLTDTWKDFWMKDYRFGPQTATEKWFSRFYYYFFGLLIVSGLVAITVMAKKMNQNLQRLAGVLLIFGLLQALSMIWYIYKNPWAGAWPTKGIYIAPIILTIGLICACNVLWINFFSRRLKSAFTISIFALLILFISANKLIPVL